MIKNYLIIAFRNFRRNKFFTLINIFGLSIGITTSILIYLYIIHELSYDKDQVRFKQIYRVVSDATHSNTSEHKAITPYPLAPVVRNEMTGYESVTRIIHTEDNVFSVDNQKFKIKNLLYVEKEFFDIFNLVWLSGSPSVFSDPDVVVLTETMAKKMFGSLDVVGKQVKLSGKFNFTVKGIVKDHVDITNIPFDILLSFKGYPKLEMAFNVESWNTSVSGFQTFFALKENSDLINLEKQLNDIVVKNAPVSDSKVKDHYHFQPLSDVRTNSIYGDSNLNGYTNFSYLIIAAIIGFFVLMLGCINYINLSLTILIKRRKEIGVRKVSGAVNKNVIAQFTIESVIILLVSLLFAIVFTELILPTVGSMLDGQIYKNVYAQPSVCTFLLILFSLLILITGFLPSLKVSSVKAVDIFRKDSDIKGNVNYYLRNFLIILQFSVSVILIISTIIISVQLQYMRKKELGYETKNIINCPIPSNSKAVISTLQNELKSISDIENVSFSLGAPSSGSNAQMSFQSPFKEKGERSLVQLKCVDYNYQKIFNIQLVAGSWWDTEVTPDSMKTFIVNETFIAKMGYPGNEKSIGEVVQVAGFQGIIIGVIKDFHSSSLRSSIEPVLFARLRTMFYNASIKLKPNYNSKTIDLIKEKWQTSFPDELWDYEYFDEYILEQYKGDQRTFKLALSAAWIAICIALLGLLGISGYTIQQKKKTICIRRIMGAETLGLTVHLSKRFVMLVFIANVIGLPLGYSAMKKWLDGFAFYVNMEWYYFAITLIVSILLSVLIISYYAIKVAKENPANILRYE